jgi:hypothetical protein
MEITKSDFKAYEDVRKSGATNMFDIPMVEFLSGLPAEKIKHIIRFYGTFKEAYDNDYLVSNCCGARVRFGRCQDCKEMCEEVLDEDWEEKEDE